jgi:molybdopterin/thiamine biosynthesis adenylyltransferase
LKVKAQIPSYKKLTVDIPEDSSPAVVRKLICDAFGVEPALTRMKKEDDVYVLDYYWARQLLLYGNALKRIRQGTVVLVGAGAIGNEAGKNLALSGVGRIVIVDMDLVEVSNLSRAVLFGRKDVGKPKAEVLRDGLKAVAPVKVEARSCRVEELDPKLWLEADVIVSAVDNMAARFSLAETAVKYRLPLVDGGVRETGIRVQLMRSAKDACLACLVPRAHWGDTLELRDPCDVFVEDKMPSSIQPMAVAGAIITEETLKLLSRKGKPLEGVLFIDMASNKYSTLNLKKSSRCLLCGPEADLKPYQLYRNAKVKELKQKFDSYTPLARKNGRSLVLVSRRGLYRQIIVEQAGSKSDGRDSANRETP